MPWFGLSYRSVQTINTIKSFKVGSLKERAMIQRDSMLCRKKYAQVNRYSILISINPVRHFHRKEIKSEKRFHRTYHGRIKDEIFWHDCADDSYKKRMRTKKLDYAKKYDENRNHKKNIFLRWRKKRIKGTLYLFNYLL